jgi:peptide-methionine (R)-S-oxide reductase
LGVALPSSKPRIVSSHGSTSSRATEHHGSPVTVPISHGYPLDMSEPKETQDLRSKLTPEQFDVTQKAGTEPAFSGEYWNEKRSGTYNCVVCGEPLFSSKTKYDSGSGWPSFTAPLDVANVTEHSDSSFGMARTESQCGNCGAHLGHVFPDGPGPTGLRYCMNSASLSLEMDDDEA